MTTLVGTIISAELSKPTGARNRKGERLMLMLEVECGATELDTAGKGRPDISRSKVPRGVVGRGVAVLADESGVITALGLVDADALGPRATLNMVLDGKVYAVPKDEVEAAIAQGFRVALPPGA